MNVFTVSFFGHRMIDRPFLIEQRPEKLISKLLNRKEYVAFLAGCDGDFDQLVSSAARRCKRALRDDNSALVWVMSYETAEYRDRRSISDLLLCEEERKQYINLAFNEDSRQ